MLLLWSSFPIPDCFPFLPSWAFLTPCLSMLSSKGNPSHPLTWDPTGVRNSLNVPCVKGDVGGVGRPDGSARALFWDPGLQQELICT